MHRVKVVGAGLAGAEAAWQLAQRGVEVELYEMKPNTYSPAHESPLFAELVCSNSLRSDRLQNAVGLLKEEMRKMHSIILQAADKTRVPAGGALSVDRHLFATCVTDALMQHPLIHLKRQEMAAFPEGPAIIATGPLTSDALSCAIAQEIGAGLLSFFDAAAPIVTLESIDQEKTFRQSRYDRGGADYINCPMDEAQYRAFYEALMAAETAPVHGADEELNVFEGCMPVEVMAARGYQTLLFGPLKPKGIRDPKTGKMPFANLQLRQDDAADTLYNLVGFQTRLTFPAQKRVFGMIPGLEKAAFARYGVMHRNTFINAPKILNKHYRFKDGIYFAGQITGVEGYVESAASGLIAGIAMACELTGQIVPDFSDITMLGALGRYVAAPQSNYQPMHATYGLIRPLDERIRNKQQRYLAMAQRSLEYIEKITAEPT